MVLYLLRSHGQSWITNSLVHLGLTPDWGFQGPAYLHKIKTSHGLKIINCIKIRTDRDGPFLGAKTLLWKIINNVISNTNQKGVSRDRRWNENYLSAIICHLHSENWFRHICQTCHQDIWKLFAYPYGQSLSVILEPIIFTSKLIRKPTDQPFLIWIGLMQVQS